MNGFDITANARWVKDCQGKQDLDFSIIDADTRYWPDFSAQCRIKLRPEFNPHTGTYVEDRRAAQEHVLCESEIFLAKNEYQCKRKVRKWYNRHIVEALEKAFSIITKED